jgi:hypothetical protein
MAEGCAVTSVLGVLEEREAAARVRVEGLREEAARLAEVLEAGEIAVELGLGTTPAKVGGVPGPGAWQNAGDSFWRHRGCSVPAGGPWSFASPSYREALSPCAYNGKITPAGNLLEPHVP